MATATNISGASPAWRGWHLLRRPHHGNMKHELTILAYEMNGEQLSTLHGAPLRLRCENELGFKQIKWVRAIEFVDDFSRIGSGEGGYNEDHEFFGYRMPI